MNKTIFTRIQHHCTEGLWSLLLNADITIDDSEENEWEISEIMDTGLPLEEVMKIICCFEKVGGVIIYNGEFTPYVILCKKLDSNYDKYRLFWIHNVENGVMPIFDLGEIIVPAILPKYAVEEQMNGFCILRLYQGRYIPLTGEIYPNRNLAEKRAEELNFYSD